MIEVRYVIYNKKITCICGTLYSFHILPSHSLIRILQFYRQNMFDSSSFAKKEIEMEFK